MAVLTNNPDSEARVIKVGRNRKRGRNGHGPGTEALIGMAAGVLGAVAMTGFTKAAAKLRNPSGGGRPQSAADEQRRGARKRQPNRLDDISVVGPFHRKKEPATETLGRVAYRGMAGREPSRRTRERLGSAAHWGFAMGMGALYALSRRGRAHGWDLTGGLVFGSAVWLVADELMVPLLGLAAGPTSHDVEDHAMALGAHLAYGAATAAAAEALHRVG